jgi:VWFA-related protein/TonB family protein
MQGSGSAEASHAPRLSWSVVALSIYVAGVAVLLLRAGIGWVVTRRLERSARLIDDEAILARAGRHAAASGLPCVPRLAESDRLFIPVATSVLRPMIVLPGTWREWDAAKLDAVLAHEISHVARRDALTQRLSLVYRAVSWYNPFSWWLHHHWGDLAEQVSDEAALGAGVEGIFYAETLLGFLADRVSCPPRRADWHVAMVHGAGAAAEQRVERILAWDGRRSRTLTRSLVFGVALAAAPTVLLAAAVRPEVVNLRVDLPVVAAPGLGQPAGPTLLAIPAAMSASASDRAQAPTPVPLPSSEAPTQVLVSPAPTAPIDTSQGSLPNASFGGHRMFVVLFDLSSMTAEETQRAVNAARKWTDKTMLTDDLVALASIGSTLQLVRDFTNDKARIQAALDEFAKGVPKTDTQGSNDVRVRGLKTICDDLLPIQQHKAILYFSSGMQRSDPDQPDQIELRAAVASCERANTSINPVDARGLPGGTPPGQVTTGAAPDHTGPLMLSRTVPDYTPDALKAHIEGDVELEAVVLSDGTVGDVRVTKSLDKTDGLDLEAVRCVRQWTFTPGGGYDSRAAALPVSLTVEFRMHGQAPGPAGPRPLEDAFAKGAYQPDVAVGGVVGPLLLKGTEAHYTSDAMRAKLAGEVVVEAIVMPDGTVGKVRVVESLDSHYGLDDEAVKAVEQWLFRPAMLNTQPVPALVTLTVPFRLH